MILYTQTHLNKKGKLFMIIQPSIRMNVALNAHPIGIKKYITEQANYIEAQPKFAGPKKALIIGGSTGYGLATRLTLALGANTETINVSFESAPFGKRTGSAGFWNNIFANEYITNAGIKTKDFLGDAFSTETKKIVAEYIRKNFGKLDLLVYSLASGKRKDPNSNEMYTSALKVRDEVFVGETYDINTETIMKKTIEPATASEIEQTIKVMGGEDWQLWIDFLLSEDLLAEGFQTYTYSYIGPELTKRIYREGTIGAAKEDMEQTARKLNEQLQTLLDGKAATAVCRAAITRASAVIPSLPIYGMALTQVMSEKGREETPIEHVYRLFKTMIYGENAEIDRDQRLRPDNWEMATDVQAKVATLMAKVTAENLTDILDVKPFKDAFLQQNGFGFADIDYEQDIDIEALVVNHPLEIL